MPDQLEIVALGLTALLAGWLGLTVLVRSSRMPGATVFAWLAGLLVVWPLAIVIQRTTSNPWLASATAPINLVEDVGAFLLPAAVLHIALVLSAERRGRLASVALMAAYGIGLAMIVQAAVDPARPIEVGRSFTLFGLPSDWWAWSWILVRLAILGMAVGWLAGALRRDADDLLRRRQLQAAIATVVVGAFGGVLRILPEGMGGPRWVGVSFIALSLVLATYAVFAQHLFLAREVAGRAFRYSVGIGLALTGIVGLVLGADLLARRALSLELPIVAGVAMVVAAALLEPFGSRLRIALAGLPGDTPSDRLLQALGEDLVTAQRPDEAIRPALARITRTLDLTGATLEPTDGKQVLVGGLSETEPTNLELTLESGGRAYGSVRFGPKRSGLPVTGDEVELLELAAGYLAASLRLAERHDVQAQALEALSVENASVTRSAEALDLALVDAAHGGGLRVYALGPLRAERGGLLVRQWGGAKAGSRQAQGLFAFLFDRGERAAGKDEIIDLIWPDVDLEPADLAFHRTLGGLRTTLRPERRRGARGEAITYHNDRYGLDPDAVEWSDVSAFEDLLARAGTAAADERLRLLEQARALYRGDYLDDCPFYGDSSHVEERRELLRGRYLDLLLSLGESYEAGGQRVRAADCFRQARAVAGEQLPAAEEALARLGVRGS